VELMAWTVIVLWLASPECHHDKKRKLPTAVDAGYDLADTARKIATFRFADTAIKGCTFSFVTTL
jgi:hypothetical protein